MSGREATFSGQNASFSARLRSWKKPFCEMSAPRFSATRRATSLSRAGQAHQHRLAKLGPLGNGAQVTLALGADDIDQIGFGKPRRKLELG